MKRRSAKLVNQHLAQVHVLSECAQIDQISHSPFNSSPGIIHTITNHLLLEVFTHTLITFHNIIIIMVKSGAREVKYLG